MRSETAGRYAGLVAPLFRYGRLTGSTRMRGPVI